MTCPSCGAALAEDQRYCLNCGQRQGEPRVDFQRHLDPAKRAANASGPDRDRDVEAPASAPPAAPPDRRQRDYAPLAAAGGIAVLGIMLLIGVLIGRGTGSDQASAPAPQVVTVAQGASEGGAEEPAAGGGKKSRKEKGGKKKNAAAGGSTDTGDAPIASEQQLEALQGKTGQEYAEESAKLPDEIATPGEAPPTDGKAPGGGSGGVTIE
ncbi:MAG TPA: zinc ribbon domain-containing protein [Solirubrobacterales bacterium]|nr:zinc ribbon domain-containing protein [Solirubrobacterales bacterium]